MLPQSTSTVWHRFTRVERSEDNRHIMAMPSEFPFLARSWELRIQDYLVPNWHEYAEIALIEEGAGLCLIGDSLSALEPEMVVLIPPGRHHTFWSGPGSRVRFRTLYFHPELIAPPGSGPLHHEYLSLFTARGPDRPLHTSGTVGKQITTAIRSLCAIDGCPSDPTDRLEALSSLLGILALTRRLDGARIPGKRERLSLERWGALNALLGSSDNQWPTLDAAAETLGMSRWGFCRFFKEETSLSWTQWLRERAVERARDLLTGTEDSISRIALDSGFNNQSWFNRSFRSIAGCTPGEYREMRGSGA